MPLTRWILFIFVVLLSLNVQAGFFEELGKDLSMLTCQNPTKKATIESMILNEDPSRPQIWWYRFSREGKLIKNPDPRRWYTIHKPQALAEFFWEARLSRYVRNHRLQMFRQVRAKYFCGHKVYTCVTMEQTSDSEDRDDSRFHQESPADNDGGRPTDDDDSSGDSDDNFGDDDDNSGDSDDNFGDDDDNFGDSDDNFGDSDDNF
jgi:hypothetical protein